ncbi:hypothetical protein MCOR25_003704 [Pyricularia grisea]|nr:hypothetical protein MCOR25_003704 [Pyricularia grisea]
MLVAGIDFPEPGTAFGPVGKLERYRRMRGRFKKKLICSSHQMDKGLLKRDTNQPSSNSKDVSYNRIDPRICFREERTGQSLRIRQLAYPTVRILSRSLLFERPAACIPVKDGAVPPISIRRPIVDEDLQGHVKVLSHSNPPCLAMARMKSSASSQNHFINQSPVSPHTLLPGREPGYDPSENG